MGINRSSSHRNEEPESGVLYLVGTPIGNLSDVSERAIKILKSVDYILCEDTRHTKKILTKFDIRNLLISFNQHNSHNKVSKIISDLKNKKSIALVSDAGMPIICDPGEELVHHLKLNNIESICVPGPSAVLTALITSGMKSSRFIFEGFAPKKKKDREELLFEISNNQKTTILFESPHRIKKLLLDLKRFCGGRRGIFIGRELTKKFEEHIGPDIDSAINHFNEQEPIGEITVVLEGINKVELENVNKKDLRKETDELINAGLTLSGAAKYLAKKQNINKNTIYNLY